MERYHPANLWRASQKKGTDREGCVTGNRERHFEQRKTDYNMALKDAMQVQTLLLSGVILLRSNAQERRQWKGVKGLQQYWRTLGRVMSVFRVALFQENRSFYIRMDSARHLCVMP